MKSNRYAKPPATGRRAQERIAAYYRMAQQGLAQLPAKPKPRQ